MENVLLQKATKLNRGRKQRKWWQRAVRTLAAVAVFGTTYALILPAITMEAEPVCGLAVHEHTESCNAQQTVTSFLCTQEPGTVVVHTHSGLCYDASGALVCTLPEVELHQHVDACVTTEKRLTCVLEEVESHSHSQACTTSTQLVCQLEETEEHTHGEGCYVTEEVVCDKPEVQGHAHTDACYTEEQVRICGREEVVLHTHQADCYDGENNLICGLPQVQVHAHTESCVTVAEETVLVCQLAEHVHTDACYPAEDENAESGYYCGSGVHTHVESCYDEAGTLTCTIPEHTHDVSCIVENYDPAADVETEEQWKQSVADAALTGIWADDLLAVARTQLGYTESARNVILEGETLKGYTRYGAKFGDPYGDWDAMFVAFCLEYAEITEEYIPYETSAAAWAETLAEADLFGDTTYTPVPGDLVFVDKDADGEADHVGILIRINDQDELEIYTGNTDENMVGIAKVKEGVVGYGILPANPLTKEEYDAANALAAQIAALPAAETVEAAFQQLNDQGDQAGYEALRQEITGQLDAIYKAYEGFNDLQKARAGSLESLEALKELCGGLVWRQYPALTDDSAYVAALYGSGAQITEDPARVEDETVLPENAVRNGDWVTYSFTVETASYYTDISYGEALVKVELVLPFAQEEAVFDISAITWLEDPHEKVETRSINGEDTVCQVLTGYKRLKAEEDGFVVPGSFTETVPVKLRQLGHGDKLMILISAAMEHSTWDGVCETHQAEEKLTIATEPLTIYAPLSAEEQQAEFEKYQAQLEALPEEDRSAALNSLEQQIKEAYESGALSLDHFSQLHERILELSGVDLDTIAEPSKGSGWIWMDFDAGTTYTNSLMLFSAARSSAVSTESAMPTALYSQVFPSAVQIDREGGENSADDAIYVSKTIQGTDVENVFDITLQVITREEVNEVYKEPDMAVVIVMDISNTMTSVFSGETTVTRYDAAMDSAEAFMKSFAEETDGISRLGYVAFNTHGHEIFPMQECSTLAQAENLNQIMRTETESIMTTAAAATSTGEYKSSHERFTNIQAGLKMAEDMLAEVNNQHKYVIFLSDGFPTTYMTASTTDGYKGYDPYTSSGSNGNDGVFYDRVMGHHCDYGTSYSDTAAIKAREQAVSMKADGIKIFSIGVDVEGQTIWEYHWDSELRLQTASTVERRKKAAYYNSTGYEIGTLHSEITKYETTLLVLSDDTKVIDHSKLPASARASMAQDFKDWLKGTDTTGIGSNFYYNSTDEADLSAAYADIFEKILEMNAASAHTDWIATDPMPGMGVHELETIEFIGFWDMWSDNPTLVTSLTGASQDNSLYYNSATFNTTSNTISWDLKNSGYQSTSMGNTKNFLMEMKYRVRLMNEETSFVENQIYDTNDVTSMTYRIIEVKDGVTQVSDQKSVDFPIPAVHGFLGELNFMKVDPSGNPLEGAKFQLTHDTESCGFCRGDDAGYVELPTYEATSGEDGMVQFTNIPSGHCYTLTETEAPAGFAVNGNTYKVQVAYDALTVTVTDADGNDLMWSETIENITYYELPSTGGMGTSHLTFGGALLMMAASLMYICNIRRKQRKGGVNDR